MTNFNTNLMSSIACLTLLFGISGATPGNHHVRQVNDTSKAGMAWANSNAVSIRQYEVTGKVSWYYTWSSNPVTADLEFVPLLWGTKTLDQFSLTIQPTLSQTRPIITAVLGMNEPDQTSQSNLTALEGAQMWKSYLEPLRVNGVRLGSPAISSAPAGKTWLQDFFTVCAGNCTVDFIALNWYGVNATQFIQYLYDLHGTFQKPLWVTEWACQNYVNVQQQCSENEIVHFMNETQSFMDGADFVERYAWFGAMKQLPQGVNPDNALMDTNGDINALGRQYIKSTGASMSRDASRPAKSLILSFLPLFLMSLMFSYL